jgi:hypothetical protein
MRQPEPGLALVSGGEGLPHNEMATYLGLQPGDSLQASGRSVIFRALLDEILAANPVLMAVQIASASSGAAW